MSPFLLSTLGIIFLYIHALFNLHITAAPANSFFFFFPLRAGRGGGQQIFPVDTMKDGKELLTRTKFQMSWLHWILSIFSEEFQWSYLITTSHIMNEAEHNTLCKKNWRNCSMLTSFLLTRRHKLILRWSQSFCLPIPSFSSSWAICCQVLQNHVWADWNHFQEQRTSLSQLLSQVALMATIEEGMDCESTNLPGCLNLLNKAKTYGQWDFPLYQSLLITLLQSNEELCSFPVQGKQVIHWLSTLI